MEHDFSTPSSDGFAITTSLRSDLHLLENPANVSLASNGWEFTQFYMLDRHQKRMWNTIKAFEWPEASSKEVSNLKEYLQAHLNSTYGNTSIENPIKLRVTLSSAGVMNVTSMQTAAASSNSLFPTSFTSLFESSGPTFRISVSPTSSTASRFTTNKTTNRAQYDAIRAFLPSSQPRGDLLALPAEILLVDRSGHIMEGSITTPYFSREKLWITPHAAYGGNIGTTRAYALSEGLCQEGDVRKDGVQVGERVVLSNGVRGFGWGVVEELEEVHSIGITTLKS